MAYYINPSIHQELVTARPTANHADLTEHKSVKHGAKSK